MGAMNEPLKLAYLLCGLEASRKLAPGALLVGMRTAHLIDGVFMAGCRTFRLARCVLEQRQ